MVCIFYKNLYRLPLECLYSCTSNHIVYTKRLNKIPWKALLAKAYLKQLVWSVGVFGLNSPLREENEQIFENANAYKRRAG